MATTTEIDHPLAAGLCQHCRRLRRALERCQPLSPNPWEWGARPFWGTGALLNPSVADHPAFQPGDCACKCHDIWRAFTGNKVTS